LQVISALILLVLLIGAFFYVNLLYQEEHRILAVGETQDQIAVHVISSLQTRDQKKTVVTLDVINYDSRTVKRLEMIARLYDDNGDDFEGILVTEDLPGNTTRRLEFTTENTQPQYIYRYEIILRDVQWEGSTP